MALKKLNNDPDFAHEILNAQTRSVLSGVAVSVIANTFVGLTTAAILYHAVENWIIISWLLVLSGTNFARLILVTYLKRSNLPELKPASVLRFLTGLAIFSGFTWAAIPLILGSFDNPGTSAYVVFIIGGISAGAVTQSPTYAPTAIGFILPQLVVVCFKLFAAETGAATFVALNATLLTIMMVRSALSSEKQYVKSVLSALESGRLAHSVEVANRAISDTNRKLEQLANNDALTNLASRACFNSVINDRVERAKQKNEKLSLLIFDLDKFKYINDTFGHAAGDAVLAEFARRMLEHARHDEFAARLGGDEFAIIVSGENAAERAHALANDILAASFVPIDFAGNLLKTGASIGISTLPKDANDVEGLFQCADAALYKAKELGRRRVQTFDTSLRDSIHRQKTLERSLAAALRFGKLHTEFQPQISLADGKVTGFETLLRWQHPTLGSIAAEEIVLAARNTQNTIPLTSFVTQQACEFLLSLDTAIARNLTIAVNISPVELTTRKTALQLVEIVKAAGVEPKRLEFDITEETLLDAKAAQTGLALLEEAGFQLALDDFGMGHSSLAYLIDNRIDKVKIDRQFIAGIADSAKNQALVSALISVANALSMTILAEGVENKLDSQALRMLGCQGAQGFLYARPMDKENAIAWLNEQNSVQAAATA